MATIYWYHKGGIGIGLASHLVSHSVRASHRLAPTLLIPLKQGNRPRFTGIFHHKFEKYLAILARTRRQAFLVTQESCIPPPSSDSPTYMKTKIGNRHLPWRVLFYICAQRRKYKEKPSDSPTHKIKSPEGILRVHLFLCGIGESDPCLILGKDVFYHWTNSAYIYYSRK